MKNYNLLILTLLLGLLGFTFQNCGKFKTADESLSEADPISNGMVNNESQTSEQPIPSGTDSSQTPSGNPPGEKQTCPTHNMVIDPWPYQSSTQVWIRQFDANGTAMQFSKVQLETITSKHAFTMTGEAGGGAAHLSLCPGDLTSDFPAAVYYGTNMPCTTTADKIYMTEAGAKAKYDSLVASNSMAVANRICFLKMAEAFYMNISPTTRTGYPQWKINVSF